MALVTGTAPLDMRDLLSFSDDGEIVYADNSVIRLLGSDNSVQELRGSLQYTFDPSLGGFVLSGGVITDIYEFYDLNLIVKHSIQGISLPVALLDQYITANDGAGLLTNIFQGSDTFVGHGTGDYFLGYAGSDTFSQLTGTVFIDGGSGNDIASFSGTLASYQIAFGNGQATVTSLSGVPTAVTLTDVEGLQFADTTYSLHHSPTIFQTGQLPRGTTSVAASSLFSISAPDGPITRYRFIDSNAGGGRFFLNGVAQPEGVAFDVTAAQLADLQLRLGPGGYNNAFWLQVYDGYSTSEWTNFQLVTPTNTAPVVSVGDKAPAHGASVLAAASLFTVNDADGDPIKQYKVFDGTAGNGRFRRNGVDQPELVNLTIDAADLGSLEFVAGGGSDVLWVQASDGASWSAWKSFTVFPPPNAAPMVSINTGSLNPARGTTTIAASSFFGVSDADGDTIAQYRFFDGTAGNGRFELNGAPQTELANLTVSAADLANFRYRVGGAGDTLWVQAFDGISWSAWKSFNVSAPPNAAPAAVVSDRTPARGTTTLAAASLLSTTDADGDTITAYKFFDGTQGNGHFRKNGVDQAALVNIDVSAADLATTEFLLGGGSDVLWVQAYDGISWSSWKSFTVNAPQNNAPVLTMPLGNVVNPGRVALSAPWTGYSIEDADNDEITQFRFFDGTVGNGHFEKNGTPLAELQNLTFDTHSGELAGFAYRASTTGVGDTLWMQVYDGISWSNWLRIEVTAPQNHLPTLAAADSTLTHATATSAASSLFSASDADGDTITTYRLFDGTAGNGHFTWNGAQQAELKNLTFTAAELSAVNYVSGGGSDVLWVQAFDGYDWSAWKSFTVTAPPNTAPVVTVNAGGLSPVKGAGFISVPTFFSVSDADGDAIAQFRFFDGTLGNGHFDFNFGTAQPEQQNFTINASDLYKLNYVSSTNGSGDTLWVQAYDGMNWGAWKSFDVAAQFNLIPVVRAFDVSPWVGLNTISVSSLFSVDDDDAPVRYRIFDGTVGNGRFQRNGVEQVENQNITVEAADLANFRFVTSTTGSDVLWVQAYDGFAWSAWKNFTVAAQAGDPPSSGGGGISVGGSVVDTMQPPPETFFESTSPTGDTYTTSSYAPDAIPDDTSVEIGAATRVPVGMPFGAGMVTLSQWQFWDATSGGGAFSVDGVAQAANQVIDVMVDQMEGLRFLAGNAPGADQLWVRAHGDHGWGAWKQFSITTLAPT